MTSDWAWQFARGPRELDCHAARGKYFERLQVRPGKNAGELVVLATPPKGARRWISSAMEGSTHGREQFRPEKTPARLTIRLVAGGDRMLVLVEKRLERQTPSGGSAEIGSTRKGSSFAKNAASGPECVVTGGLGTIAVEHEGKSVLRLLRRLPRSVQQRPGRRTGRLPRSGRKRNGPSKK